MTTRRMKQYALSLALLALPLLGCCAAAAADFSGTVKVGLSTALSGAIAPLGVTGKNGIELTIKDLNDSGGVLGQKIALASADSEADPATGVNNVRHFILGDGVKAVFGPVSSAVAAAEEKISRASTGCRFFSWPPTTSI